MIDYNVDVLSPDLQHAFFHLDRGDPTAGFAFDATAHYGPTWPEVTEDSTEDIRLVLASHLAGYLRHKILEKGYAATVGISSSKLLAKLIGNVHKPNNQTTLLPSSSNITRFLDDHQIKQIPGIGSKMAEKLHVHLAGDDGNPNLTVRDVRQAPGMGPAVLDRLWHGPGSSRGIGMRIWGFLHGMDSSDVMEARDLPTQISIEDTYGRLDRLDAVKLELVKLASSLLRRMRVDLTTTTTTSSSTSSTSSWRAHPRTLRLSSRLRTSDPANPYLPRSSRSAPLPSFVFSLEDRVEALAERLVHEHLLTLELTNSGHPNVEDKISPIDIMIALDECTLPRLRVVRVSRSLNWHSNSTSADAEALCESLQEASKRDWDNREGVFADMDKEEYEKADWAERAGVWAF